jgi:hypothetical protein
LSILEIQFRNKHLKYLFYLGFATKIQKHLILRLLLFTTKMEGCSTQLLNEQKKMMTVIMSENNEVEIIY